MQLQTEHTQFPPPTSGPQVTWPMQPAQSRAAGSSWTAWTLATLTSIWTAVVLIGVFSPDMIHGSEQQHMPIAAFGTWLWGFGASIGAFVVLARLRGDLGRRPLWVTLFGATVAIWTTATLLSIFGPTIATGSDPTTIPIAALIAPVVAMLATFLAGTIVLVAGGFISPSSPSPVSSSAGYAS